MQISGAISGAIPLPPPSGTAGGPASSEKSAEREQRQRPQREVGEQTSRQAPRTVNELTPEEQRVIQELRNRDREVRAHELAHQSVGGRYAGAASFSFQRGPDGRAYAIGGEVPMDVGREGSPEDTLRKMQIVQRAALAPAEPSPQDRAIAAQAAATAAEARAELAELRAVEQAARSQTADRADGSAATDRVASTAGSREGEYLASGSQAEAASPPPPSNPVVAVFAAVEAMGGGEFLGQGGRLDLFA